VFDLSFWEITVILIVALLVVGPERLPGLARTAGLWMGKARRFVASVKADIDREFKTEELRRLVDKQAQEMAELREMLDETKSAIDPQQLMGTTPAGAEPRLGASATAPPPDTASPTQHPPTQPANDSAR
jgi:sec-independent protein translocase protein TatB